MQKYITFKRENILYVFVILLSIWIFTSCTPVEKVQQTEQKSDLETQTSSEVQNTEKIDQLNHEVENLKKEIKEKDKIIEAYQFEQDQFAAISRVSLKFMRGCINGDVEQLKSLFTSNMKIEEKENKIVASYFSGDQNIEYTLYDPTSDRTYQDMVINGFKYVPEEETYIVILQTFYDTLKKDEEEHFSMGFIHLLCKKKDCCWKINEIAFDI